ncbi:MAG: RIP metalloprotease RseP [Alphaproteobacteria bacterium]|nr:RIP metalloprotease RseP [Alphaproteobacteria bacterium]
MDFFRTLAELSTQLPGGETLYTIFVFVVVLGILVFIHEWGHYAAAKSVGIKVEEFAIGFGKAIIRWTDKHGTDWKIAIIPLGGYVRMKGQEDGKPIELEGAESDSFAAKSLLQRSWVVFAGPFANFVLALVVFAGVLSLFGEYKLSPQVGLVQENMPAMEVGLQEGDIIHAVNDTVISTWDELQKMTAASAEKPLHLIVKREESLLPIMLTPQTTTFTDLLGDTHTVGRIGIAPSGENFLVKYGIFEGVLNGALKTWEITALTVTSVYKLIIGAVSPEHLAGPLGIANMASESASHGTYHLLFFLAIISINLGIVNLIPIPVLDGGHLVFFAIEAIKGSPVGEKTQAWSLRIGITLILLLVLFSTGNDIQRMEVVQKWMKTEKEELVEVNK